MIITFFTANASKDPEKSKTCVDGLEVCWEVPIQPIILPGAEMG
jgi:hypothetical protein